jgi:hypothetical protein
VIAAGDTDGKPGVAWRARRAVKGARREAAPLGKSARPDAQLVQTGIEAVVDAVDPRLRSLSGYAQKIAPAVTCTIVHLRELASRLPEPIELSRGAWADDAFLNAAFATAEDISLLLARSPGLKRCLEANAGAAHAYALLGMVLPRGPGSGLVANRKIGVSFPAAILTSVVRSPNP